ncbi:hypothetical protein G6F63_013050 [Rhizopus arrhizus]|nr:hypothetical protein G6F63_013050 [Rhizopus arrhizus]
MFTSWVHSKRLGISRFIQAGLDWHDHPGAVTAVGNVSRADELDQNPHPQFGAALPGEQFDLVIDQSTRSASWRFWRLHVEDHAHALHASGIHHVGCSTFNIALGNEASVADAAITDVHAGGTAEVSNRSPRTGVDRDPGGAAKTAVPVPALQLAARADGASTISTHSMTGQAAAHGPLLSIGKRILRTLANITPHGQGLPEIYPAPVQRARHPCHSHCKDTAGHAALPARFMGRQG